MNPLYEQMKKQGGNNQMQNMMKQFEQFKKTFSGNPQEQVQQLLNSGKVSQAQYNNAVQMAQKFRKMFGM